MLDTSWVDTLELQYYGQHILTDAVKEADEMICCVTPVGKSVDAWLSYCTRMQLESQIPATKKRVALESVDSYDANNGLQCIEGCLRCVPLSAISHH